MLSYVKYKCTIELIRKIERRKIKVKEVMV